ncbi:MAG: dependent methyltransferase [Chloroflexi bacterium]|nr:dependent methyltransferase [Chloroflexota bacterium]
MASQPDDGVVTTDAADDYALLDCGAGRRLESFGSLVLDRPAPGAVGRPRSPERWAEAMTYRRGLGWRTASGAPPEEAATPIRIGGITVEIRPTTGGQVGLFPEHAAHARWLTDAVRRRLAPAGAAQVPEVLNLFGSTGLATLIVARAGGAAVHVDSSRPAVAWGRRNAERSGLSDRPIRWIVDDALAFVRREHRRGRRYAGLVLDPPSYGHGPNASTRAWEFDRRIAELLEACRGVADPEAFWLVTTHTPGWDAEMLATSLAAAVGGTPGSVVGISAVLTATSGATLRLGAAARLDPHLAERR